MPLRRFLIKRSPVSSVPWSGVHAALTAVLCVSLVAPSIAQAEPTAKAARLAKLPPLTEQQKVLHALNRLTFGPTPGEAVQVEREGLNKWFEGQLHPERINDAALDARLEAFPAMRLSISELLERFPSPQMTRRALRKGAALPADPTERVVYADFEAAYAAQQAGKEKAAATAKNDTGATSMSADTKAALATSTEPDVNGGDGDAAKGERRIDAPPMGKDRLEALLAEAPAQRYVSLLGLSPADMLSLRTALRPVDRPRVVAGLTPAQREVILATQSPVRVVGAEALESRLLRDIYSDRQLQAVMADFWTNHFNVYAKKNGQEPYFLPDFERNVILPNALGNFEDLLVATAKSSAMLMYLDNWESMGPDSVAAGRVQRIQQLRPNGTVAKQLPKGINENYARELMELHTLGVGGGYTQTDVIAVAKCFTGWTLERPGQGMGTTGGDGEPGSFIYEDKRHEPGEKVVLGRTIHEAGQAEGLEVLHLLATSPATAKFISGKLAVRFVSDNPPPALVNRMAATFLKTHGDIKAVLTTMFHSPDFWSPEVYRAKVKTPLEFLVSAARASGAQVDNVAPLVASLDRLGMPLYGMQTPNGYSWQSSDWVSSNALISRMNFALVFSGARLQGTHPDWTALLGTTPGAATPNPGLEEEAVLEHALLGAPASAQTRAAVLAQSSSPTVQQDAEESFRKLPPSAERQKMSRETGPEESPGEANLLRVRGAAATRATAPASPLDTMAGLLLGSPDFQRR